MSPATLSSQKQYISRSGLPRNIWLVLDLDSIMSCGLDLRLPAASCRDAPSRGHIDMKLMCISLNNVKSVTLRAAPNDPKIASDRTIKHSARMRLMILSWGRSNGSKAVVQPCCASRAAWHVLLKTLPRRVFANFIRPQNMVEPRRIELLTS